MIPVGPHQRGGMGPPWRDLAWAIIIVGAMLLIGSWLD